MRATSQRVDEWPVLAATATPRQIQAALAGGAAVDARDAVGRTASLVAAKAGRLDIVRVLIAAGADIDAQDDVGHNPLLWGCVTGDLALVRTVVEAGADVGRRTRSGGVGMHPAAERGFVEVVEYLARETDVDVDHADRSGWTPLLAAILLREPDAAQAEIVRLLLAAGADPSLADPWGVSPLRHARQRGAFAIAAQLEAALV